MQSLLHPQKKSPTELSKAYWELKEEEDGRPPDISWSIVRHARSEAQSKFAMGGKLIWGPGGEAPAAGGTGVWGRSPQRSKFLHFLQK